VSAAPLCAVCGVPVERFEEQEDAFMQRKVFIARCHGETERVVLSEAECSGVQLGQAFTSSARRLA